MTRIKIGNRDSEGSVNLEQDEEHVAELVVPAAEMRALAATVKELVAAPGAGKALYPRWISVEMLGTVAFGGIASAMICTSAALPKPGTTGPRWRLRDFSTR